MHVQNGRQWDAQTGDERSIDSEPRGEAEESEQTQGHFGSVAQKMPSINSHQPTSQMVLESQSVTSFANTLKM